jgi:hypothetical protein
MKTSQQCTPDPHFHFHFPSPSRTCRRQPTVLPCYTQGKLCQSGQEWDSRTHRGRTTWTSQSLSGLIHHRTRVRVLSHIPTRVKEAMEYRSRESLFRYRYRPTNPSALLLAFLSVRILSSRISACDRTYLSMSSTLVSPQDIRAASPRMSGRFLILSTLVPLRPELRSVNRARPVIAQHHFTSCQVC